MDGGSGRSGIGFYSQMGVLSSVTDGINAMRDARKYLHEEIVRLVDKPLEECFARAVEALAAIDFDKIHVENKAGLVVKDIAGHNVSSKEVNDYSLSDVLKGNVPELNGCNGYNQKIEGVRELLEEMGGITLAKLEGSKSDEEKKKDEKGLWEEIEDGILNFMAYPDWGRANEPTGNPLPKTVEEIIIDIGKDIIQFSENILDVLENLQRNTVTNSTNKEIIGQQKDFEITNKYYQRNNEVIVKIASFDDKYNIEIQHFTELYEKYSARYERIAEETGVPPELIASLHYHENASDFDWKNGEIYFSVYLHNGEFLGKETTLEPKRVFFNEDEFDKAAIDALEGKYWYQVEGIENEEFKAQNMQAYNETKLLEGNNSMEAMLTFAEYYNGVQKDEISSYLYNGALDGDGKSIVTGKYVSDHVYSETAENEQPGIYLLLKSLCEQDEQGE